MITLLAESGRAKLTTLVLGSEQERALHSVAKAAIELTVQEIYPADEEKAAQLTLVIGEVFNKPVPNNLRGGRTTMLDALKNGVGGQLAVLGDPTLTGQHQSAAEMFGISATELVDTLIKNLVWQITIRASRGGPLVPLATQINHDMTHLQTHDAMCQLQQTHDAVRQIGAAVEEALQRLEAAAFMQSPSPLADTDIALYVEQLLGGLKLGEHHEAERRVNRLFLPLVRNQQRAAVDALIRVATTTQDHTTQLVACSLLEAADRLDPTLLSIDDVDVLARSADSALRISAAVLLWQWATSRPDRVPIPLLGRLTQPSTEYWYVHAAARAGAKQLLLSRGAARAIFDRMAASQDPDDRHAAATDLLEVARIEPRAVPAELARRLAHDQDMAVATQAAALLRMVEAVEENERENYYGQFWM